MNNLDINLTDIMLREGIRRIHMWTAYSFSVELSNGRVGYGRTVGDALAAAKGERKAA